MNDATLLAMTDKQFRRVVKEVLTLYRNGQIIELTTSPLACSSLIKHYIFNNEPQTTDILYKAIQSILIWAVEKLRPTDEPDWLAPHWRSYNILYHFYIRGLSWAELAEHMHTSEQNISRWWRPHAVTAIARILQDELKNRSNSGNLKQAMLAERYSHYTSDNAQRFILHFLSIFQQPVPYHLLHDQAQQRQFLSIQKIIRILLEENVLSTDQDGKTLWIQPDLQAYVKKLVSPPERQPWHHIAGQHYLDQQDFIEAAYHFYQANEFNQAAQILVDNYQNIISKFAIKPLQKALGQFTQAQIYDPNLWARLKISNGKVVEDLEDIEAAIVEYRAALQAPDIKVKALAYYCCARVLRFRNSDEALAHYEHGIMLLEERHPEDPLLVKLYANRAWIFLQEQYELDRAEADLLRAQALLKRDDWANGADLYNALGELFYQRNELEQAVEHRLQAWMAANEVQDMDQMMRTVNNVGQDYAALGQYDKALEYLELSKNLAKRSANRLQEGSSYKAIGTCYFWLEDYHKAIRYYKLAQEIFIDIKNYTWLAPISFDLTEAYACLEDIPAAKDLFDKTLTLCREINDISLLRDLDALAKQYPYLKTTRYDLSDRQEAILTYIKENDQITNKVYRELTGISQKQATRDLNELVNWGLLKVEGKGRGTRYIDIPT